VELIRIVFAELPGMLRDIIQASLVDQPDILLVGEVLSLEELEPLVKGGKVDVVLLGVAASDLPASYYRLFDADAHVRILAIADQGKNISLYELSPQRIVLREGSVQDLLDAIRASSRSRRTWEAMA
jgi:DNA-binding NarL/FixJ family response regulator